MEKERGITIRNKDKSTVSGVLDSVSKCDCSLLVAFEICGGEKNLDGDFWKNKKKHDKLTQEDIEEDCRKIPN